MLFNSAEFLLFLPIVFGLKKHKKSPTEVGLFWLCKSEEKRLHHASHAAGTGSSSGSSR